jgi:hypothetical protein
MLPSLFVEQSNPLSHPPESLPILEYLKCHHSSGRLRFSFAKLSGEKLEGCAAAADKGMRQAQAHWNWEK